jgi:hypothetical protein
LTLPKIKYVGKGFIAAGGKDVRGAQLKGLIKALQKEMKYPDGGFILRSIWQVLKIRGEYTDVLEELKEIQRAREGGAELPRVRKKRSAKSGPTLPSME